MEPRLEVHVEDLGQRIGAANPLEVTREGLEGVVVSRLVEKLRRAEGLLLVVAEHREIIEVGPLERLTQVQKDELQAKGPRDPVCAGIDAPEGTKDAAADRTGNERADPAFQAVHAIPPLVSRENLVASVTREGHRDLLARRFGYVVGGQGGGVGEGLVEVPDEPREVVHAFGRTRTS